MMEVSYAIQVKNSGEMPLNPGKILSLFPVGDSLVSYFYQRHPFEMVLSLELKHTEEI